MLRRTLLHVSLCILLAQHITGETQNIDGLQNEDIVLCPTFSGELEDITWKLGNNKVAEYDSFKVTTYYGYFKKETELNIKSGCLKMNNITNRRDGLYTAELQIGGQLQYHEFKLKVYRPVSKPNVACSVTDSNVTLLCEGDESLGDHYRWEVLENQVHRGTTKGKNLTFSKEENHNIEYTCIFSNLKSEERSDPIKNCFVPGGRSHIWVLILVLLAVAGLAGLMLWSYKYYSKSQGKNTSIFYPLLEANKNTPDSENEPGESSDPAKKQEEQMSSEKTSGNNMPKITKSTEENSVEGESSDPAKKQEEQMSSEKTSGNNMPKITKSTEENSVEGESSDPAKKQEEQMSSEKTSGNNMPKITKSTEENSVGEQQPHKEHEEDPQEVNSEFLSFRILYCVQKIDLINNRYFIQSIDM
ncbi:hypothetical protein AOXY_G10687 [Acipenser oxyrinchus oxyrinchus]|uniref:Ig-like domain-containing protein n=1 Tax=Acipenser oxyrinchus oxyrinchus TaxID=40147 RepID=A0AAD8G6Y9_ACIOX|nr:hypothetical protein AOXY_G10687 [Acipenser oxyrinchus oxyrinchus]